jgi:hypothetical protein
MSAKNQLEPYKLSHAIQLRFLQVLDTVDEDLDLSLEDVGVDDAGVRQLDLRAERWNGLVITVEASLDPAKLGEVLAGGLSNAEQTRMVLSVRCPRTKLRRVVRLAAEDGRDGVWAGDVMVARRDVRSRIEFHPLLYRLTEIPTPGSASATEARHRYALLGTGQAVTAAIDDVERTADGPIKIKWLDFGDGKNPWLEKHRQTMYYFEYDDQHPVLWLNKRNSNLKALLFERGDDTVDSALRRLTSTWLAETVWVQLFQAAVASLGVAAEEATDALPEGWRGHVLKKFFVHMYPDQTPAESASAVIEAKSSPDQFCALLGQASTVVQRIVGSDKLFTAAVRAAEKGTSQAGGSTT